MSHRWQQRLDKFGRPFPATWICPKCKTEFSSYRKPPASAKIEGKFTCEEFQIKQVHES